MSNSDSGQHSDRERRGVCLMDRKKKEWGWGGLKGEIMEKDERELHMQLFTMAIMIII